MKETAQAYYLGKLGPGRLNCAQSIAEAFRAKYPLDEAATKFLSGCGGGRAPGGYCGAFYATKNILERYAPQMAAEKMETLRSFAGSLKCREIKALKKKSCLDCIGQAGEVLL